MFRGLIAVLLTAGALAGPACAAGPQPVSPSACQPTPATRAGALLMLEAEPADSSSIRGVLASDAVPSAGTPFPVRWLVDARKAARELRVQAIREGTNQGYRQQFPTTGTSGLLAEFPSELTFPAPGCWDADVFSGTALGSITFKVV